MAYGNLALDLVLRGSSGRLVCLRHGCFDNVAIEVIKGTKKGVDLARYYNVERLRPKYETFERQPLFIMTSE